jgi:hypothetical protein
MPAIGHHVDGQERRGGGATVLWADLPSVALSPSSRLRKRVPRVSGKVTRICKMRFTGRMRNWYALCRFTDDGNVPIDNN